MNINKYIIILTSFASLFFFTSCEKEIELDLNSVDPKLVIEGLVTLDSLPTVKLTMTKDFSSNNTFDPVKGAIVSISDNEGNSEVLELKASGLYTAKYLRGVLGRTYNLNVSVDGKEYTSTSSMPPHVVEIDSITLYSVALFDYPFPMIHFQDPKGAKNYYRELLYINGKRSKDSDYVTSTDNREGFYIPQLLPIFAEKDDDPDPIQKGDTIMVEQQAIDKGAYTFFDTLGRIGMSQTNPTTNIQGGALGYFSAYTFYRKQIIADW